MLEIIHHFSTLLLHCARTIHEIFYFHQKFIIYQRLPPKNFLKRHIGSIFNGQEQALKLDSVVKNDQLTRQFKSNLVLITKRCLRGYDELGTNDALCPNAKADHKSSILLIEKSKNNARFLSHNERLVCNLVSAFLNNLQPSCCS